jgi:hypothetical protein
MLASIVLVALNGARQKASIGAALSFADTNYHALGVGAIAIYHFDEPSGNALDSSGNNYTVRIDGTVSRSTDTPNSSGTSLALNGANNAVINNMSPSLLALSSHTLSVWVKPTQSSATAVVVSAGCLSSDGCINLFFTGPVSNGFSYIYYGPRHTSQYVFSATTVALNQWVNITYSYKACPDNQSDGCYSLYVNGNLVNSVTSVSAYTYAPVPSGLSNLVIGASYTGTYASPTYSSDLIGSIDDFALYNQSLTSAQVHEIYAMGAAKHGLAVK